MPGFISDSPLARGLIRIGDEGIAREDDAKLRNYYAADYLFHGPGGDLGDSRSLLTKLGVTTTESAQQATNTS